jgi:hypothetical protein
MANEQELSPPRLPESLKAHAMWTPTGVQPGRRRAVYVTERARRKISIILMLILVPVAGATMVWGPQSIQIAAAVALVAGGIASVKYHSGGRAGFYELETDGTLGNSLGRQSPDLSDMRRTRVS